MRLSLPIGFTSWAQVLTDWCVARAFEASARPSCFSNQPELAAPFVAEIGASIRDIQLHRRPMDLVVRLASVTEPAYDEAGGAAYLAVRQAMERAQERCFRRSSDFAPPEIHAEMRRLQTAFYEHRQHAEPFVRQARQHATADFWRKHPPCGLSDDFFSSAANDSAAARVSRTDPAWWWREFFAHLQIEFARRHAADGSFLDALPELRAQAKKKTLDGMIAEWTMVHGPKWGWAGPGHYRMLVIRAEKKGRELAQWFQSRAPCYLTDSSIRRAQHEALSQHLARQDFPVFSAHGRN